MSERLRYVKLVVACLAWSSVLLSIPYRSQTPVVLGRYSWGYVALLGFLVGFAFDTIYAQKRNPSSLVVAKPRLQSSLTTGPGR